MRRALHRQPAPPGGSAGGGGARRPPDSGFRSAPYRDRRAQDALELHPQAAVRDLQAAATRTPGPGSGHGLGVSKQPSGQAPVAPSGSWKARALGAHRACAPPFAGLRTREGAMAPDTALDQSQPWRGCFGTACLTPRRGSSRRRGSRGASWTQNCHNLATVPPPPKRLSRASLPARATSGLCLL